MSFITRAYGNRRKTTLTASFILGLPILALPVIIMLAIENSAHLLTGTSFTLAAVWCIAVLGYLVYPLGREIYFRMTRGSQGGRRISIWWGPVLLVMALAKLMVYVLMVVFAAPLGLLGLLYLGLSASSDQLGDQVQVHRVPTWNDYHPQARTR